MKETLQQLKYSFYVTVHPFKGFWEIKHEKMGSFKTAIIIFIIAIATTIFSDLSTEVLFNKNDMLEYNLWSTIAITIILFLFWSVSNWCLTCLSDGEGTLKDIMTASGYALIPYIVGKIVLIPLSYIFTLTEASLYGLVGDLAIVWSIFLLVVGILVVHQYSFLKTIVVCCISIVGMAVMTYIGILFFNLVQEMISFCIILFNEIEIAFL